MLLRMAFALLGACSMTVATAQDFPSKPLRIITTATGGFADISARLVGQSLSTNVGRAVIVDNHPGAVVAMNEAVKAPPDGYSLFLYGNGVWLAPFLYPDLAYDPLKELAPLTLATAVPYVIVVNPAVPAKSLAELIALAKSKPGVLNYGAGNVGGTPDVAAHLFNAMAGIDIKQIPYKSTAPALTDVIAGRLDVMVSTPSAMQYAKAGKLRALAVTSAEQTPLAPGLPPVADTLPGYEAVSTEAIFTQAKTPPAIMKFLNQELVNILKDPVMKKRYADAGADTVPTTQEQALAKAYAERERVGKIVKELGSSEK